MKQLTNNPSAESIDHGFTLMGILLSTFAPSPELENYLEMFLRDKREDECIHKLHLIVYGGPVPGIPRMHQIEALRGKGRRFSLWGRDDVRADKGSRRPAVKARSGVVPALASSGGGGSAASPAEAAASPKSRRRGSVEAMPVKAAAAPPLPARPRGGAPPPALPGRPPTRPPPAMPLAGSRLISAASAEEARAVPNESGGGGGAVEDAQVAAAAAELAAAEVAAAAELAEAEAAAAAEIAAAEASAAAEEPPLPEGWQEFEAEGKLFYFHAAKNKTQWDRPT
jgi:hypothetical protein